MQKKPRIRSHNSFEYKFDKLITLRDFKVYDKFINWVIGEFDLYLRDESDTLSVYFLNGWFSIRKLNCKNEIIQLQIKVKGRSKNIGQEIMDQLEGIYYHIIRFYEQKYQPV